MEENNPDETKFSPSEKNGLSLLKSSDKRIFCPGISTCGLAEIQMALQNKERKIIATTIDKEGLEHTEKLINEYVLSDRIQVKLEDVTEPMPYEEKYFDFIYARLILHYLTKQQLDRTLSEFHRILKDSGSVFIVVKSKNAWELDTSKATYDKSTGMWTYTQTTPGTNPKKVNFTRYFHTNESISEHLKKAGFKIASIKTYDEHIFYDYQREKPTNRLSRVIEAVVEKA